MRLLKIMYIWDADYPWDVRTEKVCSALSAAGHEVHIAARNRAWKAVQEQLPEGTVHRMPPWRWVGRRADNLLSFPAFLNPRWWDHLRRLARNEAPDVFIVRDLPLCPLAIRIGRQLGVAIVFDMAENYPALLQDVWDTGRRGRFDVIVRNPAAATRVERYCLPRVDHILAVVEESATRLERLGVDPTRITIVSNTPSTARVSAIPPARSQGGPVTLVYLGIMELARGIADLIDAISLLCERGVSVRLLLIGGGRDKPLLERRAASLVDSGHVEFLGYIPSHADALQAVGMADIGVIPHHASEWANTTIPNKLFDYMAAGLPVVTSDNIPCARIVSETKCGEIFRAGDPLDLALAIGRLVDPVLRQAEGQAGTAAVRQRYNWENDAATLVRTIQQTVADRSAVATAES